MLRYFFHVVEDGRRFPDEHGRELADLREAHTIALLLIEKLLRFVPDWSAENGRITVSLASGETVLTVLFPALTSPTRT